MLRRRRQRPAFTLVELLVVIGIIALLISILLPTLGKVRRAANTVKCAASLRSIQQSVQIYAAMNKGAIPGSPWTTSQFLFNDVQNDSLNTAYTNNNCPTILGIYDWMSPIASAMNIKLQDNYPGSSTPGDLAWHIARFTELNNLKVFQCPEYEVLGPGYSNWQSQIPVQPMTALCAGVAFMLEYNNSASPTALTRTRGGSNSYGFNMNPPSGYRPQLGSVGDASRKIFCGDGGRWSTSSQLPDINLDYNASVAANQFADVGPYSISSSAWCRERAWYGAHTENQQNGLGYAKGAFDPRLYGYRHGNQKPFGSSDSYKANFVFFDGHVELMGDLASANPLYWCPKGAALVVNPSTVYNDVRAKYFNNANYPAANPYIIPN